MDRRTFIRNSALAVSLGGLPAINVATGKETVPIMENSALSTSTKGNPSGRPNIIFILSDQHNAKCMSHLGHPDVKTPNLDHMAAEGVRFDACISANPICTPSRVSFLSGQHCHNHGYYGLSGPEPRGLPNILGHFRRAGYKTAAIGKIHCPANWIENDSDVFHDSCGTSVGGRSPKYTQYLKERNALELEDHGAMREFGKRGNQTVEGRPSTISYRDGQEGWSVTESLAFMDACTADGDPFFLHLSLPKPHQCYTPAQEFWDLYDSDKLTMPPNSGYDMSLQAPHVQAAARFWQSGDWTLFEPHTFEAGRRRKLHGYLGNLSHIDHAIGEVLDHLRQTGLDKNTIVVYSSDHGDYACEHDLMEKAPGISHDAITRVPYIWWAPGRFGGGETVGDVCETVDTVNTLCTLAGLEAMETSDGQDLSDYLHGERPGLDRCGVTQFNWSKSLRKGQYRLVTYPQQMFAKQFPDGFGELYDLKADPWEMKNLYFEKAYRDLRLQMERELFEWLVTHTRPTTIHGSSLTDNDSWQRELAYHHQVNADNKMHFSRTDTAAHHPAYRNYQ